MKAKQSLLEAADATKALQAKIESVLPKERDADTNATMIAALIYVMADLIAARSAMIRNVEGAILHATKGVDIVANGLTPRVLSKLLQTLEGHAEAQRATKQ